MYLLRKCDKSGIEAVYNYINKDYVTKPGRQIVTGESTPFGPLTS